MQEIFWKLFNANTEDEVSIIINSNHIFSDPNNWKPYGNNKGNFGTFESQQNHPIPALIEKITNSIDATLLKQCRLKGIDPKSNVAPKTMNEAVELFYNVNGGEIGNLGEKERRELAENIQIIAIGDKSQPSIIIYDNGEGQNAKDFESTFLSLHQNNKTNIHFVQGKYNMGSTGAVVFCGENKFQLIASKRSSELRDSDGDLGFTLVRRHPLTEQEEQDYGKATWYEYFCPDYKVPSFPIKEIELGLYNRKFSSGSIVKLYSYQLPRGSRSDITLDLWRDLNQYMYHLPLPISVYEKRDYSGKTPSKTVLGNRTRILIDSRDKVYKKIQFNIPKEAGFGEIPIEVMIFNVDVDHGEFIKNKSIIFTQNGQVHGYEGQSFISQDLGFSLLKKHMLIHVNCTEISTTIRQDLFMSNRTHLKHGPKTEKLRDEIIDLLKKSSELRRINNDRKSLLLRDSESDKGLLEDFLSKLPVDKDVLDLLRKDGTLNFLKKHGDKIKQDGIKKEFQKKLNRFPSMFKLNIKQNDEGAYYKTIPINQQGRIEIETDVENDYLFRPTDKGKFEIHILQKRNKTDKPVTRDPDRQPDDVVDVLTINREGPDDGTIKLIIKPNAKAKAGDEVKIRAVLSSPGNELECVFIVKVDEKISEPKTVEKRNDETFPRLPYPQKAYENPTDDNGLAWSNPQLNWNGNDIVKVITGDDSNELMVSGIIVNMDSYVLKNFLSRNRINSEEEIKYNKDKYFMSIYFHSLFLFSILQKMRKEDEKLQPIEIDEFVSSMIKPYANFLMYENYHITKAAFD